jgi:acetyltransferase-like isoleucine patch superfamily enzyme
MHWTYPSFHGRTLSYDLSVVFSITQDSHPLPPPATSQEEDDQLFEDHPWVERPVRADYGINIFLGSKSFVNFNAVFIDTCPVYIGARCLIGPNCSFYSGGHPLDPAVRNGLEGPEFGKDIQIGDDCWLGGNVIILPGITIGRGSTIGAGSVVTKVTSCTNISCLECIDIDLYYRTCQLFM